MDLNLGQVAITDLCEDVERAFRPVAEQNGLAFRIERHEALPAAFVTDEQRLQQILRNLLSNAFKFTHDGSVTLSIEPARGDLPVDGDSLRLADGVIALSVSDTGVGIPDDKLSLIFEAFQQADGTTSRKYGGTGLGLSISREIARLLGGEIHATSTPGHGSTFTLYLPLAARTADAPGEASEPLVASAAAGNGDGGAGGAATPGGSLLPFDTIHDDRATIVPGDRILLLIAHDADRAAAAMAAAREAGFKALVARRTPIGLALAREYRPDAIVIFAGDGRGDILLGQLKQHPDTRHRPVYVIGPAGGRLAALRAGAAGYFEGPGGAEAVRKAMEDLERRSERTVKRLALVEDGFQLDPATLTLLGAGDDVDVVTVSHGDAPAALRAEPADCAVLPLGGDSDWLFPLLEAVGSDADLRELPLIVYTAEPLSQEARQKLEALGSSLNLKSVSSAERLVDETALFLHRMEAKLPAPTRKLLGQLRTADSVFHGKRVLIVDDDIRNVFALASALEVRGMKVVFAENGREGIDRLKENPDVDLVLLDVMMPEMDGYETARAIRAMPRFEQLPIISLTAKAMKGDRDKSIGAGASDYITKPVDMDQLLSLMRVWLHR
jgi:CheY-like chemotaxis protein